MRIAKEELRRVNQHTAILLSFNLKPTTPDSAKELRAAMRSEHPAALERLVQVWLDKQDLAAYPAKNAPACPRQAGRESRPTSLRAKTVRQMIEQPRKSFPVSEPVAGISRRACLP